MAYVLTLVYTAIALLSPGVFPDAIVRLHINEILGLVAIIACVLSLGGTKLGTIPEAYFGIGMVFAVITSTIATGWLGALAITLQLFLPIIFNFYFVVISCRSLKRLRIFVGVLASVALFILSQGILAYFTGNLGSLYLEPENVGEELLYRFRGLGVLSDPNDLAQFFVVVTPLLWLRWKKGSSGSNFLFTLLPAAILTSGVFFTHSRGGTFALLAMLLFAFKDRLGLVKSGILVAIVAAGFLALNISGGRGMTQDDGDRVGLWSAGLTIIKTHPVFGIGIGNFGEYTDNGLTAHNSYVLCMAELGVPGYIMWMGMIVAGWTGLSRIVRSKDKLALESDQEQRSFAFSPARQQPAFAQPALAGPYLSASAPPTAPAWSMPTPAREPVKRAQAPAFAPTTKDEDFAYAAKVLRVSFVGLLSTSFFLSRTYAMIFYVLLGMVVALRTISPFPTIELGPLAKRTAITVFASIAFIYLFVRLHGFQ